MFEDNMSFQEMQLTYSLKDQYQQLADEKLLHYATTITILSYLQQVHVSLFRC